jgi:broad specificity phosphatase PhoE
VRWLSRQPYEHVAVVTHGVFLECLLEHPEICPGFSLEGRRVYNCDAYACECRSTAHSDTVSLHGVRPVDTTAAGLGGP